MKPKGRSAWDMSIPRWEFIFNYREGRAEMERSMHIWTMGYSRARTLSFLWWARNSAGRLALNPRGDGD